MNNFKILSQHVDTVKTHYKISKNISDDDFNYYAKITNSLTSLKKEAQEVKNNYGSTKSINYSFGDFKFNILPTSITGFSIVIQNSDFQLAIKQSRNKINGSPLIKAELRAEFLARLGYIKSLSVVNNFIKEYLLSDYQVDISEIHLATDIQGHDFKPSHFFCMKTRMRTGVTHDEETLEAKGSTYGTVTTFTGMSFGSGDYMMRIYNKSKEIQKFKNKSFAKTHLWEHNPDYDPNKTVWRMEIQIRRAKLKKMVNSNGNTMDNYFNCLNGIPDLWAKALTDYEIKDVSRENTSNLLHGDRVLKDGTVRELTKHSITKIFKRSPSLPFWSELKTWNKAPRISRGLKSFRWEVSYYKPRLVYRDDNYRDYYDNFIYKQISTAPKEPKRGSQEYVNNSIKSLYSTLAKHKGSVTKETLTQAFIDANEDNIKKRDVSLLEDSFNKQLDWIELIEHHASSGVCNTPDYKDLENEIINTVLECDEHIKNIYYSPDILDRIEARLNFTSQQKGVVIYRDLKYISNMKQNLELRLEANLAF